MSDPVTIVPATQTDRTRLVEVLARAFQDDPVSIWVFPDERERSERHPAFFMNFLDLALATGEVYTTADRAGAALWLQVQPDQPEEDDGFDALQRDACGPYYDRFAFLGKQMESTHPHAQPHWYLQFIGVEPERQEHGIGTALLSHRLADLDAKGLPAYLESSSPRNITLYERWGFRRLHPPIDLPDGPPMRPMWREPGTQ